MKKLLSLFLIIVMLFAFSGCDTSTDSSDSQSDTDRVLPRKISLKNDDYKFIITQTDEKLYYCKSNDSNLTVCSYDLYNSSIKQIGEISDYLISKMSIAILENKIYFFITTRDREDKQNGFYYIDTVADELKCVYTEKMYQALNYITEFCGKLFITKGDIVDGESVTFVEMFDTKNNGRNKFIEKKANTEKKEGGVILNIASNEDNLFVYYEIYESSNIKQRIDVFDKELNFVKTMDVTLDKSFFTSVMGNFYVNKDYGFMRNFSNESAYFNIKDVADNALFSMDDPIALAQQGSYSEDWVLFKRDTKSIYTIDANGELVESSKLKIDDEFVIKNVTQNDENVILWTASEDDSNLTKALCYKYSELF